jgi:hypothetical protein
MYELFAHFTRNSWIYETKKIYEYDAMMTPDEKNDFAIDPKSFDWVLGTHLYAYGGERYLFKQDRVEPDNKSLLLLHKNNLRYFDDSRRVFTEYEIITQDPFRVRSDTL